jgi:hypothetical protein
MVLMKLRLASLLMCVWVPGLLPAQTMPPSLVLEGQVTFKQNKTWMQVPFSVPANVHRISVDFSYTGKDEKTALDLGIFDPHRFRGESGGNKSHFTISETDATPSYLLGAIDAGEWHLLISVPNIRRDVISHYRAEIRFNSPLEDRSFTLEPLATGRRWYRGDLHMHTAHSDGSCASQSGKRVPCPLFLTVRTATERGLDFIAITDHNTDSQYDAMRELQPYFDKILLIPGREITTFWGHFNIFGVTQFVDFRTVPGGGLDVNAVLRDVAAKGGIASINHALSPGGEICMGCRWEPPDPVDIDLFTGVEVINGGRGLFSSAPFWQKQLDAGHRLTAIGGSDNHNAPAPMGVAGAIASPTTVVEADELSVESILGGIRRGRVFIDLTSSHDKVVDIYADAGNAHARMGEDLTAHTGETVHVRVHTEACAGALVHLLVDGHEMPSLPPQSVSSANGDASAEWTALSGAHEIRAEIRDTNNKLLLVSNPIYIDFPPHQENHAS